jgi:NADH-quinone oxidoreductase subunit H
MTEWFQSHLGEGFGWFTATTILILMIALPLMLAVAMVIYADRKIWAAMALRKGPNVVGPFGLLQSFADGLKVFLKETIIPSSANRGLFILAPILTFSIALTAWAVIPFGPGMVLANVNVGLLYLLAVSSLGVYGIIIAGWASNSKYPFYSALRAAAQMVSYEVSIGFVLIPVILFANSFNLGAIIAASRGTSSASATCSGSTLCCSNGGDLLHRLDGGNRTRAVRPHRGGERARCRLPDRI